MTISVLPDYGSLTDSHLAEGDFYRFPVEEVCEQLAPVPLAILSAIEHTAY
jgi:hypothetical protein